MTLEERAREVLAPISREAEIVGEYVSLEHAVAAMLAFAAEERQRERERWIAIATRSLATRNTGQSQ